MKHLALMLVMAVVGAQATPFFFNNKNKESNYNFEKLPDFKNYAAMARFLVHNSNHTAVSYQSKEKSTFNLSLSTIFSLSDGYMSNATGIPYFYLTEFEPSVQGLVRNDSRCGLMMSLVQTGICDKNKWDPEDPRCARVFLTGNIKVLKNNTEEYKFAKAVFTNRHPYLKGMPSAHSFFYAKYVINTVKIISGFGGRRDVSLKDYYNVKDPKFNLYPTPTF